MRPKELLFASMMFLFSSFLPTSFVFAQGSAGAGGGVAWVCRDGSGNVTRARMLELGESEQGYQDPIQDSHDEGDPQPVKDARVKTILSTELSNFNPSVPSFKKAYSDGLDYVQSPQHTDKTSVDEDLVPTEDWGHIHMITKPHGCNLENVGHYVDGILHINGQIFDKMSSTGQAVFWGHESIYTLERTYLGALTSERSRALNIYIVNGSKDASPLEKVIPNVIDFDSWGIEIKSPGFAFAPGNTYSCDISNAPKLYNTMKDKKKNRELTPESLDLYVTPPTYPNGFNTMNNMCDVMKIVELKLNGKYPDGREQYLENLSGPTKTSGSRTQCSFGGFISINDFGFNYSGIALAGKDESGYIIGGSYDAVADLFILNTKAGIDLKCPAVKK